MTRDELHIEELRGYGVVCGLLRLDGEARLRGEPTPEALYGLRDEALHAVEVMQAQAQAAQRSAELKRQAERARGEHARKYG